MGQLFIDEVRAIVLKNISNEKFGVGDLSSQLGLSSSQTLRKVKAAAGKSVNQYIRELRLEKAAKLIKKTDDSMAEIAYQVGFSSPSYFNKAFAKYYGIAPGEYKTKSISLSELADQKPKPQTGLSTKNIGYVLAIVLVGVLGYFLLQSSVFTKKPEQKSIAVLPFKDFSPEDSQWFSDGVSDNILHSLAQMHDLSVTSFTSSATYRDTKKQIPQIAKELGVAYVLEGSITLYENDLKIIVQLIDADDNHVWSKEYNEEFKDVITIQNNVSQEVLKQLELTLSPEEQDIVERYPTDNMEAYNLHMEGRRINHSIKLKDLQKNIENNKQAIALDSSFVEAYAEVAATNLILAIANQVSGNHNYIKQAQLYVDKALALDPNSAKANAVKARLLLGNDWSGSKTYFDTALALNPNDADSHHWYAYYFLTAEKPDLKKALDHATKAKDLSPFSYIITERYIWILMLNEKYDEFEAYLEDYGFLLIGFEGDDQIIIEQMATGLKNKDWKPTFDHLYNKLKEDPENAAVWNFLLSVGYDQIFIDKRKAADFARESYEIDSSYLGYYLASLADGGFFKETEEFMQTDDFKGRSAGFKSRQLWLLHYYRGDFNAALDLIEEKPTYFYYGYFSRTYAQLGDRKKLDSINKLYFLQNDALFYNKAHIHAILKERDSMYHYLKKLTYMWNNTILRANGDPVFDPYRNEERFKALLREMYIPTEGEQYTPPSSDN